MIKKLLSYLGEYKKYTILTPLCMVGEVTMELLIPLAMAASIDTGVLGDGGMSYTLRMGTLIIIMAIISLGFGVLGGKYAAKASMGLAKNVREGLFDKVQDFSFSNVDKFTTASLVTRLTTDVTNTQNAFMMIIRMAVRAPIMLVGATIMAVYLNARLSLVFFLAIPILALALYLIMSKAHPRFLNMLKSYDALNSNIQEGLIGARVVKAFVREDYEKERFVEKADDARKAQVLAEKLIILNMPIMQLVMYTCIVAVLWFGGNMVIDGSFEIGVLTGFINYITQILMALMMLSMVFIMIVISKASVTRIIEVLEDDVDLKETTTDSSIDLKDSSIEFKNVNFSYGRDKDNLTLENINIKINSGETIGIVGGTGSAKTTLVQLIPRLYDVLKGEVIVGGHNVKDYGFETLRNEVGMVLQNNVLFSGTIKENLKWGNEKASDEEIIEACQWAKAHEFIMSFPKGYKTDLGQGGVNVSGGQKQRLCIARALLKKPKIIILDDSTSAVDTATDSAIRKAFREQLKGTTKLIIAQRITSIEDAHRIIVLNDGKINGFDSHDNLLKHNEIYQEIYESQQKGV
ncbi:ATP-binding cassette subfamily B protein [Natranaerovirga hydrolytica]|uniref:ATP-binding cassette subfamily B protein n=1 Tax=Natranaerovirga hydrolytica TaxID=680378 RepID=A0A4R1M6W1_9FIRM|nr:ABC transporter ATP-binding protein [Natranaerovirga hydrolytica]TCK88018.1 ATP-binding cassette subfamily B protein [Natranaerovirga hydrolytica]